MGSQHPSPNVKNPLRIRAANWLEMITSRDAKSTCFQGSQTSCAEIISGIFFCQNLAEKDHITLWMRPAEPTLSAQKFYITVTIFPET